MDVVQLDRLAGSGLATLISGIRADQYDSPTPCPEWTVGDLVAHLIGANMKYTAIAEGAEWQLAVEHPVLGEDPATTYRDTLDAMLRGWRPSCGVNQDERRLLITDATRRL